MSEVNWVWFLLGVMAMAILNLCWLCLQLPSGILLVIAGAVLLAGAAIMICRSVDSNKKKQGGQQ